MNIKCFIFLLCQDKNFMGKEYYCNSMVTICSAPGPQASWFMQPAQQICFISLCYSYPRS